MNGRVLVPYDGSEQSADALSYALTAYDATDVVVLHVIEPYAGTFETGEYVGDTLAHRRENAETRLANELEEYEDGDDTETVVAIGRPVHEILTAIESHGIDHVVMGSHGRDGAVRLLLGSVAETVVRRSPVPVTVVRDSERPRPPETVLVPFDGSTAARHALEYALDGFSEAAMTALYVLYPPGTISTDASEGDTTETLESWEQDQNDHAADILDIAGDVADERDRELQRATADGKPSEAIVEYVEEHGIDHVVIGSTGRDGISRLLLGSVAETVVRRSPVSVTVVK